MAVVAKYGGVLGTQAMASTQKNAGATPRIDQVDDGERRYVISPATRDLFVRTGQQIIDACQLDISVELWIEELNAMCDHVRDWVGRNDRVRGCYCSPMGHRVTFFFMPISEQFDFELADELAELTIALKRFNVGMVELQQIPADEVDRFLDVKVAKRISVKEPASPKAVGA